MTVENRRPSVFHEPYAETEAHQLYKLQFGDDLAVIAEHAHGRGPWAILLADPPDVEALRRIPADRGSDSRFRALACRA